MKINNTSLFVSNICKNFDTRQILNNISFYAKAGEILSIIGPNGGGKTTLFECIQGLIYPDSGYISLFGIEPKKYSPDIRARIGTVFQGESLPQNVNVISLLKYIKSMYKYSYSIKYIINLLELGHIAKTKIKYLSGGQKKQVGLAVAIVGRPDILLLDEPTAGMDLQYRNLTCNVMQKLQKQGTCIVLITHHLDDVEKISDYTIIISKGKIIASGNISSILELNYKDMHNFLMFETEKNINFFDWQLSFKILEYKPRLYKTIDTVSMNEINIFIRNLLKYDIKIKNMHIRRRNLEDIVAWLTNEKK